MCVKNKKKIQLFIHIALKFKLYKYFEYWQHANNRIVWIFRIVNDKHIMDCSSLKLSLLLSLFIWKTHLDKYKNKFRVNEINSKIICIVQLKCLNIWNVMNKWCGIEEAMGRTTVSKWEKNTHPIHRYVHSRMG